MEGHLPNGRRRGAPGVVGLDHRWWGLADFEAVQRDVQAPVRRDGPAGDAPAAVTRVVGRVPGPGAEDERPRRWFQQETWPRRGSAEPAARRDYGRPIGCEAVGLDELRRLVPALRRPHDERRERVGVPGAERFLAHVCRFRHHHAGLRRGDCGRPQGHGRVLPGPDDEARWCESVF